MPSRSFICATPSSAAGARARAPGTRASICRSRSRGLRETARRSVAAMRPGRGVIASTRSPRNTASVNECVISSVGARYRLADALQLEVHLVARHRIERAERLVEQQELAARRSGRGRWPRAASCRPTVARARRARSRRDRPGPAARARVARRVVARRRPCSRSGSATFSSMLNQGSRRGSWNTTREARRAVARGAPLRRRFCWPVDRDRAARRLFEAGDHAQDRGLAAAGWAEDRRSARRGGR